LGVRDAQLNLVRTWAFRGAFAAVMSAVGTSTFSSFFPGPGLLLLFASFVFVSGWKLAAIVAVFVALFQRRWSVCLHRTLILFIGSFLAYYGQMCGDYVHLFAAMPYYYMVISQKTTPSNGPAFFPWKDLASPIVKTIIERTIVYDPVGHFVSQPAPIDPKLHSHYKVEHLIGSFYMQTEY